MFNSLSQALTAVFAYAAVAGILGLIILLVLSGYILSAIALFTMAKNKGIDHAWFAWLPFLDMYLLGEIIDDKVALDKLIIPYAKWILTFGPIVCGILGKIPYVGWIFTFLMLFYSYVALYRLFKLYAPDHAVLYLVFSILFFWIGFLTPLFMVIICRKEPHEYLNV